MESTSEASIHAVEPGSSHAATVLLSQLNSFQRVPKGISEQWRHRDQEPVAKEFLREGGFSAWFAYAITKHRAHHHTVFSGKANCRRLIANLQGWSPESLKSLAIKVSGSVPASVEERLHRVRRKIESATMDKLQRA